MSVTLTDTKAAAIAKALTLAADSITGMAECIRNLDEYGDVTAECEIADELSEQLHQLAAGLTP